MIEEFKLQEDSDIRARDLARVLDSPDTTGPEAERLIKLYEDQCFEYANRVVDANPNLEGLPNRETIRAQINVASMLLYSDVYKGLALEWVQDARRAAEQDEFTRDLIDSINDLLRRIDLSV
jgi:hypothetical protein